MTLSIILNSDYSFANQELPVPLSMERANEPFYRIICIDFSVLIKPSAFPLFSGCIIGHLAYASGPGFQSFITVLFFSL
jgi:hypothetical protein